MNKGAVKFFEEKIRYEIDPYSVRHIVDEKDKNHVIVDVRDVAINAPAYELDKHIKKLPKNKKLILNCQKIKN